MGRISRDLEVTASASRPGVVLEVDLASETVRALELSLDSVPPGQWSLYWAPPGTPFGRDRLLRVRTASSDEPSSTVRFSLRDHPHWSGPIGRLRLDLPLGPGETLRIAGLQPVPSDDPLAPLAADAWTVSLENESRSALLVTPSRPFRRELGADDVTLEFGYGLPAGVPCDTTLEVLRSGPDGQHSLLSRRLAAGEARSWRDVSLELTGRPDGTADIEFSARPSEGCDSRASVVAISSPRLLSPGRESRPHIVLISIDTLRADRLGTYGYERGTSPELDEWAAQRAIVFETAWAGAPWTLPSHATMLTGRTALTHGVNSRNPAPRSLTFLAEHLRADGYLTAAWTGGSWMSPSYGLSQGFDRFRWWVRDDGWRDEWYTTVREVESWLAELRTSPIFLFLHTYEVHSPYRPRQPHFGRLTEEPAPSPITDHPAPARPEDGFAIQKRLLFDDGSPVPPESLPLVGTVYDSGVAHMDRGLRDLLAAIDRHLGDNTVVLITSDHGEALGERGHVSHGHLETEDLRIPWILRLPGDRRGGQRIGQPVGSVDITPTLLDLAGLSTASEIDGASVLALIEDPSARLPRGAPLQAYAGSSNLGLAFPRAEGEHFRYNDTPWLRHDTATIAGASERPLQRQAIEALAAAAGLHLKAVNTGPHPVSIDLAGPCVGRLLIKLVTPSSDLQWIGHRRVRWTVAPGTTERVRLDSPVSPCLTVEVPQDGETPFRMAVNPNSNQRAWKAGRLDGRWGAWSPESSPEVIVEAWLQGPSHDITVDPAASDAELARQLRDLGYLD